MIVITSDFRKHAVKVGESLDEFDIAKIDIDSCEIDDLGANEFTKYLHNVILKNIKDDPYQDRRIVIHKRDSNITNSESPSKDRTA